MKDSKTMKYLWIYVCTSLNKLLNTIHSRHTSNQKYCEPLLYQCQAAEIAESWIELNIGVDNSCTFVLRFTSAPHFINRSNRGFVSSDCWDTSQWTGVLDFTVNLFDNSIYHPFWSGILMDFNPSSVDNRNSRTLGVKDDTSLHAINKGVSFLEQWN